jgi:hypothetical protein
LNDNKKKAKIIIQKLQNILTRQVNKSLKMEGNLLLEVDFGAVLEKLKKCLKEQMKAWHNS